MTTLLVTGALALLLSAAPDTGARAVLDTALARMGGRQALASVERVQLEAMTEWQRTALDARPNTTVIGYELTRELRDYARPAWRYSRQFFPASLSPEIVNVIVDSVATTASGGRTRPLNVAYVTEREEVFTFAPERIVTLAREAADARLLADTTIAGARHARVVATVGRFRPTLFFRRGDGLLALARFRAGQPDDFGLAPWGEMDVDVWYSRWQKQGALTLAAQLDVHRVGRPYKRVTILSLRVNPEIPADTFAIADSLRQAFLATARRPMHDLPLDSARMVDGRFAVFGTPGTPAGAVKVGGRWLLVETGTAPFSAERSAAFLRRADAATPVEGALVTAPAGAGGLPWVMQQGLRSWVAPGARAYVAATLRGFATTGPRPRELAEDGWIRIGGDSLRLETIDVPDFPRTTVVYVPSLRWAYAWPAGPLPMEYVAAHVRRRGWTVDRIGSARSFAGTALPVTAATRGR